MANVKGLIALKLDKDGCDLMIMYSFPEHRLFVCEGNYTWNWIDTTGINDHWIKFAIVGANGLQPCGIE